MKKLMRKKFIVSCLVLAAVAVLSLPVDVRAVEEVILHPGYIDVNVSIPDGLSGEHTITKVYVNASGTDSDGNPHSSYGTFYDDEFTLIVEGGDWTYTVRIDAYYYDGNSTHTVRWYKQVVVGRGHTVPIVLQPGYIDVNVSIPDGLGGEHTINRIYVYANGTDSGGNSHRSSGWFYNDEFKLFLEEGGPYTVRVEAYYGGNSSNRIRWYKQVIVGAGYAGLVTFETDSFIEGTVSVAGETVTQTQPQASTYGVSIGNPQYGFYSYSQPQGADYRLPVLSGDATYRVYNTNVRLTAPNNDKPNLYNYMNLGYKNASVASGNVEVVDFNVTPGYIEGTVTLNGASFSGNRGTVSVRVRDQQTNQYLYGSSWLAEDGTYRMPVAPGTYVRCYGSVYTDAGSRALITKYLDTDMLAGLTLYCDWEIDVSGSIGGEIAVTGINLDGIRVYGYGPNGAYRTETIYSPGEYYEYDFNDVEPGQWGIQVYAWDYEYDALFSIRDYDYYYSARQTVDVPTEGHSEVNFDISGFIEGSLMAENSASLLPLNEAPREAAQLYRTRVYAYPSPYQSYLRAYTYHYDYDLEDEHHINRYDMFVEPGVWQVRSLQLYFRTSFFPEEYNGSCELRITERNPSTGEYTTPLLSIEENETAECDFGYQTGRIEPRLAVSSGELVSNPYVDGYYLWGPDGVWDKQVNIYGNSSVSNLVQAKVALLALPGTYRLTARGYVGGANVSFGNPFDVSVGEGDVIIVDPEAPTVDIEIPPGNYQTPEDSVLFAGTITDESAIASLTINGTEVTINEDGSFELEVPDLQHGENQVDLTCCDVQENCVTVVRTVIMNNSPIAAAGDDQTVNTGPEGTAQVTLDGSDSNDPDGDELTYKWLLDGVKIAAGVNPTIELTSCGTNTIELTVNDGMADSEPNYVDVTVLDNTPPTIDCPNDVVLECPADTSVEACGSATATDECDDAPGIVYSDLISGLCPKIIERTWTATDAAGNSSSCIQVITVEDTIQPVFTAIPVDVNVECDGAGNQAELGAWLANVDANDICGSVIISNDFNSFSDGCGATGSATVTWTAVDECGNPNSCSATFTIVDTTPPTIITPASNLTVECDGSGNTVELNAWLNSNGGAVATDICGGVTWSNDFTGLSDDCGATGSATVTFTATDDCGLSSTTTATFSIVDTTAPVFTSSPQNKTVECNGNGNLTELNAWLNSAVATDVCGNVNLSHDFTSLSDGCGATGSSTVTWTAIDNCGNTTSTSATFTIEDTTPPVITCPADVTLECPADTSVAANGSATGSDTCGDVIITHSDSSVPGCGNTEVITRTWTATDECGNSTSCEQIITVVDTTDPVISNLSADYLLAVVGQSVTFSADVNDNCDDDVDLEWDFGDGSPPSSEPNHAYGQPGIYTATVTATDDCGNWSMDSMIIVVYDPSAGFTSGGGWFIPDSTSFIEGELVTDTISKANFGFIVKYKKGADDPDGNLEFQYKAGDINLRSSDMEWLVVQSTTKVRFKGKATINGEGLYTFKVTAEDNGEPGTGDWFKIEIWMGPNVDTENSPPTPKHKAQGFLGGGNIQIHQK